MQTKLGYACRVGWLWLVVGVASIACGDEEGEGGRDGSASAAGEGAGGAPAGPGASLGGKSSTDDGGADHGPGGGRAGTHNDPGDPGDPVQPGAAGGGSDSPDFDGVDLSEVPEVAPLGCVGGFDSALGALAIEAGGDASVVHVNVVDGVVHANGIACESEAGEPATADEVLTLELTGGAGGETVLLDLSEGAFTGCLSTAGSIRVALGDGEDTFALVGTLGPDVFHAGDEDGALVLDLDDDRRADVSVAEAPQIVISSGAKNDVIRADGAALGLAPAAVSLRLYGGGAGDELAGGAAADQLFGGIGNDWLDAGGAATGGDRFDGGDGDDTVDFSARRAKLVITMGDGADDGEAGEGADVADSVEDLLGGQAVNDITGGPASNQLWGGPEADELSGGGGDDTLIGNAGGDVLDGEAGNDTLYGEEGDDQLAGGSDDDLLDGGEGKDGIDGGLGDGDICVAGGSDDVKACEL